MFNAPRTTLGLSRDVLTGPPGAIQRIARGLNPIRRRKAPLTRMSEGSGLKHPICVLFTRSVQTRVQAQRLLACVCALPVDEFQHLSLETACSYHVVSFLVAWCRARPDPRSGAGTITGKKMLILQWVFAKNPLLDLRELAGPDSAEPC